MGIKPTDFVTYFISGKVYTVYPWYLAASEVIVYSIDLLD
jgi:hypothetical protein